MIDIDPSSSGLPGIAQLRDIVGAVMTVGLFLSVLALIISAIVWGFGANSSNPHLASRGKTGVLVSCGAAILCGAAVTLINFFWTVGQAVNYCCCGGRGGLRWWVCLRCQLAILRLMTRGLERCLRGGRGRSSSLRMV
ncbi:DUF6112 family protein [Streptomyces sp. NBC_00439]|nr:DUF6112 family protein [Streptomyces sp. NBC_00439]